MDILVLILLVVVVYCGYSMIKNYKAANQSALMAISYCQMLYILMEGRKFKEKDYHKLVATMWEVDSNLLDYREFNKKYEAICIALKLKVSYMPDNNATMNPKTVEWIANKLWDNRHLFQQYTEQSERMRKISESIMNDPKYRY